MLVVMFVLQFMFFMLKLNRCRKLVLQLVRLLILQRFLLVICGYSVIILFCMFGVIFLQFVCRWLVLLISFIGCLLVSSWWCRCLVVVLVFLLLQRMLYSVLSCLMQFLWVFLVFIILNSSDRYSGMVGIVELVWVIIVLSIDMCVLLLIVFSFVCRFSIFWFRFFLVVLMELFQQIVWVIFLFIQVNVVVVVFLVSMLVFSSVLIYICQFLLFIMVMVLVIFFGVVGLIVVLVMIFLLVFRLCRVIGVLIGLSVELIILFVLGCLWCGVVRLQMIWLIWFRFCWISLMILVLILLENVLLLMFLVYRLVCLVYLWNVAELYQLVVLGLVLVLGCLKNIFRVVVLLLKVVVMCVVRLQLVDVLSISIFFGLLMIFGLDWMQLICCLIVVLQLIGWVVMQMKLCICGLMIMKILMGIGVGMVCVMKRVVCYWNGCVECMGLQCVGVCCIIDGGVWLFFVRECG